MKRLLLLSVLLIFASCSNIFDSSIKLTIKNEFAAQLEFSLYDVDGGLVCSGKVNGNSSKVLPDRLEQGDYIVVFKPYYYPADDGYKYRFSIDSVSARLTISYDVARGWIHVQNFLPLGSFRKKSV